MNHKSVANLQVIPKKIISMPYRYSQQSGAVLIISLIMLLLLMIIGTSGYEGTILEERMSGNMRDKNLAFQAAESALTAGEVYLQAASPIPTPFCNAAIGHFLPQDKDCNSTTVETAQVWDSITWGSADSVAYTKTLSMIATNPRYIIEDLGCVPAPAPCPGPHNYRITARATGGTNSAVVILQSIFQI